MSEMMIGYKEVEEKVITIRGESVLLDSHVAELYGVETREINQAVKNNPDKFPEGYLIILDSEEWGSLRSKNLTLNKPKGRGQHTKYAPTAFTDDQAGEASGRKVTLSHKEPSWTVGGGEVGARIARPLEVLCEAPGDRHYKYPTGIAVTSRERGMSVSRRQMTAPGPIFFPVFSVF